MKKILNLQNPNTYARYIGAPELHPLVSVIHFDELAPFRHSLNRYGVYGLFIQREFPKTLSYGTTALHADDGSIIAVAPSQVGGTEDNGELITLSGWALLWSPELLHGSDLEPLMRSYAFFSYFATQSLTTKAEEWAAIDTLMTLLRLELSSSDTASQRRIILSYLRLIMDYCDRIYRRQRSEHDTASPDIIKRFQLLLEQYFVEGKQYDLGLPSVAYCAEHLAYSPGHFGELVRKATGITAGRYIHSFVINQSKSLLMSGNNVNETARLLGFEYPHHFTRLFKSLEGTTPTRFINRM